MYGCMYAAVVLVVVVCFDYIQINANETNETDYLSQCHGNYYLFKISYHHICILYTHMHITIDDTQLMISCLGRYDEMCACFVSIHEIDLMENCNVKFDMSVYLSMLLHYNGQNRALFC